MLSPHRPRPLRGWVFALLATVAGGLPAPGLTPRSYTSYEDGYIIQACEIFVPLETRIVIWTSIVAGLVLGAGLWLVASGRRVPALPLFAVAALPFAVSAGLSFARWHDYAPAAGAQDTLAALPDLLSAAFDFHGDRVRGAMASAFLLGALAVSLTWEAGRRVFKFSSLHSEREWPIGAAARAAVFSAVTAFLVAKEASLAIVALSSGISGEGTGFAAWGLVHTSRWILIGVVGAGVVVWGIARMLRGHVSMLYAMPATLLGLLGAGALAADELLQAQVSRELQSFVVPTGRQIPLGKLLRVEAAYRERLHVPALLASAEGLSDVDGLIGSWKDAQVRTQLQADAARRLRRGQRLADSEVSLGVHESLSSAHLKSLLLAAREVNVGKVWLVGSGDPPDSASARSPSPGLSPLEPRLPALGVHVQATSKHLPPERAWTVRVGPDEVEVLRGAELPATATFELGPGQTSCRSSKRETVYLQFAGPSSAAWVLDVVRRTQQQGCIDVVLHPSELLVP